MSNSPPLSAPVKAESKFGGLLAEIDTGEWHGTDWKNAVYYFDASPNSYRPGGLSDAAILHITGDDPDLADINEAKQLSLLSGLPVVICFNEPNQPLFGKEEDDLMSYSFQRQIETGDWSWPVLFPMVRAAQKSMDAVSLMTKGRVHRFVVYGNSKRGWTTWLTAEAGDKRVIGIAPGSIDILNMTAQIENQLKVWGEVSPMYGAYEKSGLIKAINSGPVQNLISGIDPYAHLDQIHVPILSIRGSSDPFWLPNAVQFYKDKLPSSSWLLNLPNEAHDYKDRTTYLNNLASFSRMAAARDEWPHLKTRRVGNRLRVWCTKSPISVRFYWANGETAHFKPGAWSLVGLTSASRGQQMFEFKLPNSALKWRSWFVSARFRQRIGFRPQTFVISSPIQLESSLTPDDSSGKTAG